MHPETFAFGSEAKNQTFVPTSADSTRDLWNSEQLSIATRQAPKSGVTLSSPISTKNDMTNGIEKNSGPLELWAYPNARLLAIRKNLRLSNPQPDSENNAKINDKNNKVNGTIRRPPKRRRFDYGKSSGPTGGVRRNMIPAPPVTPVLLSWARSLPAPVGCVKPENLILGSQLNSNDDGLYSEASGGDALSPLVSNPAPVTADAPPNVRQFDSPPNDQPHSALPQSPMRTHQRHTQRSAASMVERNSQRIQHQSSPISFPPHPKYSQFLTPPNSQHPPGSMPAPSNHGSLQGRPSIPPPPAVFTGTLAELMEHIRRREPACAAALHQWMDCTEFRGQTPNQLLRALPSKLKTAVEALLRRIGIWIP